MSRATFLFLIQSIHERVRFVGLNLNVDVEFDVDHNLIYSLKQWHIREGYVKTLHPILDGRGKEI